jgi:FKBP-type peptidyl-prolyl cis-trans isomerase
MTAKQRLLIAVSIALGGACGTSVPPLHAPQPEEPPEKPAPARATSGAAPPPSESAPPVEPIQPITAAELPPAQPDPNAPPDLATPPADAKLTSSGLASKVLTKGTGKEHPSAEDTVRVNYRGWTRDGVKFESNEERGKPADFVLGRKIKGWVEGVSLMVEGEQRRFWIPGSLAYGDEARPGSPHGMVVFDIELVRIRHPPAPPVVPPDLKAPPADAKKTKSGLAYKVLRPGTGKAHPRGSNTVEVHYSGWTLDGKMFDSSVERGETASFPLNGVIRGWTEGVQLMVVGERARFWIPSKLAYGDSPSAGMPAGPLVFDIELLDIKD